jgi:AraC-like DNA-binding protein
MAVTRLRSLREENVLSQAFTTEDAYLVVIYLDPPRELVIHLRGGRVRRKLSSRDNTVILDLQTAPRLSSSGGFHSINVYLPRRAIFNACDSTDEGASLRSNIVSADPVFFNLARVLSLATSDVRVPSVGEFTQHMLLAVCARLNARYRGAQIDPTTRSPGLPVEKRDAAVAFMRSHLDTPISMMDVASACGLSYRVFVRAFKRALGTSPYDWFMASRIERAKELMSDPNLRLVDIAAQMGFADQSHFHRAFLRYIGMSPGAWRGAHLAGE